MKKIPLLRYRATVPPKATVFHVVRHHFKPRTGFYLHTHADFAEIFWIENGTGTHLINNTQQALNRGSFIMIRPRDVHGFRTNRHEHFTLVNLSFPSTVIEEWEQRYFAKKNAFFWSRSVLPHTQEIDSTQLQRLQKWAEYLSTCPNLRFHLDWFLMDLFHSLLPNNQFEKSFDQLPEQLTRALEQIQEPLHFPNGARHLAKLAGYSLQHLNRILKKQIDQTAGEIVNEARLNYAARQLQLSNRKILEICLDCGFNNLGHFYLLFKKKFGVSPSRFRRRQQLVIGQRETSKSI